jgi:transposase-like protein
MATRKYSSEAVIHKRREADVLLGQGKAVAEACKQLGVTDQTYFRWRKSYGGLKVDQAKRLRELETENARLKRAVAEITVDKLILKEVVEGKFQNLSRNRATRIERVRLGRATHNGRAVVHASAVLPELQDGAPPLSAVVRERSDPWRADRAGEHAARGRRDR